MPELVVVVLAAVIGAAAALKAGDRTGTESALNTYGVRGGAALVWAAVVAAELTVAAGLLAGVEVTAAAGAAMFGLFLVAQAAALARGAAGAPCGCLGGRGSLGIGSLVRAAGLGGGCALTAGVGITPASVAGIAVVGGAAGLAAWAQWAGWLSPRGALTVESEGPPLGGPLELRGKRGLSPPSALVVFVAPGCRLCRRLGPALRALATELPVHVYEEGSPEWEAADVPGAPYAVVLDAAGIVRAKGSVNTRAQIESLLAEAERGRLEDQVGVAAEDTPTRRTLLAQAAMLSAALVGGRALIRPGEAEAYHFCGHIYTTDSCPHPTGLPRIDARGFPLRARDGHPVDDLGRPIDDRGRPVEEPSGLPMTDAEGRPLPSATRTRVCTATGRDYGFRPYVDGAWYRCCRGQVRKLVDCCTPGTRRINGDRGLRGYCYRRRRVFCVMYYDTDVPC